MNTIDNGEIYKFEGIWRNKLKINKKTDYDNNKKTIQYPKSYTKQWQQNLFINKLKNIEKYLILNNKFILYPQNLITQCIHDNHTSSKLFYINNNFWDDNLLHYIICHNIKPSDDFIGLIMSLNIHAGKKIINLPSVSIVKYNVTYLKLRQNQILIMDALMQHGSYNKKYKDDNTNSYRYSEHAGLLDFNVNDLEKVIISSTPSRVVDGDETIFLPDNISDAYDYEYFFHTHPATPRPGGRVEDGILYEFPSISDIFHFIEHYNNGVTQGSIIIAPEGMYVIRKNIIDEKNIIIKNKNKVFEDLEDHMAIIQTKAIKKYGKKFTTNTFYSKIAQNIDYIKMLNKKINTYNIHIEYSPRKKNKKGLWLIGSIYLPVYVIEPI
jgi:hypothetical protein